MSYNDELKAMLERHAGTNEVIGFIASGIPDEFTFDNVEDNGFDGSGNYYRHLLLTWNAYDFAISPDITVNATAEIFILYADANPSRGYPTSILTVTGIVYALPKSKGPAIYDKTSIDNLDEFIASANEVFPH